MAPADQPARRATSVRGLSAFHRSHRAFSEERTRPGRLSLLSGIMFFEGFSECVEALANGDAGRVLGVVGGFRDADGGWGFILFLSLSLGVVLGTGGADLFGVGQSVSLHLGAVGEALGLGDLALLHTPVWPKPPTPRSVAESSLTMWIGSMRTVQRANWAMRSPTFTSKAVSERLKMIAPISPR